MTAKLAQFEDEYMSCLKLNLGCGSNYVDGWINIDYALGSRLAQNPVFAFLNRRLHLFNVSWDRRILIHDLRRSLPFENDSIDVIYSSHTLEHLRREDGFRLLTECHRILKTGGIVRIVVPDFEEIATQYVNASLPAEEFLVKVGVVPPIRSGGLKGKLGRLIGFPHRCMHDTNTLLKRMEEAGFRAAK